LWVAALAACIGGAIAPANAQAPGPIPTVTKDINAPGLNPYQAMGTQVSDTDEFRFPVVPAGKRLVITNVTAQACVTKFGGSIDARLFTDANDFIGSFQNHLGPFGFTGAFTSTTLFFVLNQQVLVYVEPNATPAAILSVSNNCPNAEFRRITISGYLVNLPES
jgi:hypothetical protein